MVSLLVMWQYAAPDVSCHVEAGGMCMKLLASEDAATLTCASRSASAMALVPQAPVWT